MGREPISSQVIHNRDRLCILIYLTAFNSLMPPEFYPRGYSVSIAHSHVSISRTNMQKSHCSTDQEPHAWFMRSAKIKGQIIGGGYTDAQHLLYKQAAHLSV